MSKKTISIPKELEVPAIVSPPTPLTVGCSRCADLEAALREVDRIRHRLKDAYVFDRTDRLVAELKAPCAVLYR